MSLYRLDCRRPKDSGESQACEDRRSADIAEDSLVWVKWQTLASVVGLAALVITIIYTRRAATAATIAARAAQESAEAVPTIERAYVFVGFENFRALSPYAIDVVLKNFGKTPAIIKIIYAEILPSDPGNSPVVFGNYGAKIFAGDKVIESGQEDRVGKIDIPDRRMVYVAGYVGYDDIFKKPHTSCFCMRLDTRDGRHYMAGSRKWNDHT